MRALALLTLSVAFLAAPAAAQLGTTVQVGARYDALSGPYGEGDAFDVSLQNVQTERWWRANAAVQSRFGERVVTGGVAGAATLGYRWVAIGSLGGSTAGVITPRASASGGIGRKWGERRQLLTTLTATYRDARSGNRDLDLTAEAALYTAGAVLQAGVRATESQPGDALGYGGFVAVTLGDPAEAHVTARLGGGREAYLLVGPDPLDVAFHSAEAAVGWHRPVGAGWALHAQADFYANPYYTRAGIRTGVSHRF